MNTFFNRIAATVRFSPSDAPDFFALAGTVCWCLRQADIVIHAHDLGLTGDSMRIETDHGTVTLSAAARPTNVELSIEVETGTEIDATFPRQICFQLTRRLTARFTAASIIWEPSLQLLRPTQFTWGSLRDMPSRLGDLRSATHYRTAIH